MQARRALRAFRRIRSAHSRIGGTRFADLRRQCNEFAMICAAWPANKKRKNPSHPSHRAEIFIIFLWVRTRGLTNKKQKWGSGGVGKCWSGMRIWAQTGCRFDNSHHQHLIDANKLRPDYVKISTKLPRTNKRHQTMGLGSGIWDSGVQNKETNAHMLMVQSPCIQTQLSLLMHPSPFMSKVLNLRSSQWNRTHTSTVIYRQSMGNILKWPLYFPAIIIVPWALWGQWGRTNCSMAPMGPGQADARERAGGRSAGGRTADARRRRPGCGWTGGTPEH